MLDHDKNLENYVPRFGALYTTRVKPVVLVGIWVIFLPVTMAAAAALVMSWDTRDFFTSLLASVVPLTLPKTG